MERLAACFSLCNFGQAISLLWASGSSSVKSDFTRWSQSLSYVLESMTSLPQISQRKGNNRLLQQSGLVHWRDICLTRWSPHWKRKNKHKAVIWLAQDLTLQLIFLSQVGWGVTWSDDSQSFWPWAKSNTPWNKQKYRACLGRMRESTIGPT